MTQPTGDTFRALAAFVVAAVLVLFVAGILRELPAPWSGAVATEPAAAWRLVTAVQPGSPAAEAGVRPGDYIPVDLVPPAVPVVVGGGVALDPVYGRPMTLRAEAMPARVLIAHGGPLFLSGLAWLAAGLVLALRRRDDPATRVFFAAHVVMGAGLLSGVFDATSDLLTPPGGATWMLHRALLPIGAALLLHGFVRFRRTLGPIPAAPTFADRALVGAGYTGGVAGAALAVTTTLPGLSMAGVAALHLSAVGVLVVAREREHAYAERQQLGWLLVGLATPPLATLALVIVARLTDVHELGQMMSDVAALSSLAVPGTIAFATLKYRLLDVEVLLGRRLLDVALLLPLAALAGLAIGALRPLPSPREDFLALLVGALALATWWGLRVPLRRQVARRMHGRQASPALLARRAQAALEADPRPDVAFSSLAAVLAHELGAQDARILTLAGDGRLLVFGPAGALPPTTLPPDGRVLGLARLLGAPIPEEDLRAGALDDQELRLLASPTGGSTSLLAGCVSRGELVAILQLGPGRHRGAPERSAYRALAHLAAEMGPILEPRVRQAAMERRQVLAGAVSAREREELLDLVARDTVRRLRPALAALRGRVRDEVDAEGLAALERLITAITAAESDPRRQWLDAAPIVDEACLLLEPSMAAQDVTLARRVDRPAPVLSDPDRLRLVVTEMLRQAVEALRNAVGPRQISLVVASGSELSMTLLDTGPERPTLDEPLLVAPWPFLSAALLERLVRLDGGRVMRGPAPPAGQQIKVSLPASPPGVAPLDPDQVLGVIPATGSPRPG